jgi:hypothetical protein
MSRIGVSEPTVQIHILIIRQGSGSRATGAAPSGCAIGAASAIGIGAAETAAVTTKNRLGPTIQFSSEKTENHVLQATMAVAKIAKRMMMRLMFCEGIQRRAVERQLRSGEDRKARID